MDIEREMRGSCDVRVTRAFDYFADSIAEYLRPGCVISLHVHATFAEVPSGAAVRIHIGEGVLANQDDQR